MSQSVTEFTNEKTGFQPSVRGVIILLLCLNLVSVPLALIVYLFGYTHLLGFDVMRPFYLQLAILFVVVSSFSSLTEWILQFRFRSSLLADLPNSLLFCTIAVSFMSTVQYLAELSPIYEAISASLGMASITPLAILAEITVGGIAAVAAVLSASFFSRYCRYRQWVN